VFPFFERTVALTRTEDFRGVLFVPQEFEGRLKTVDQVAIGVAYNSFNGLTCCMHAAIQKPVYMSRKIIEEVFEYPFLHCGMNHVIAPISSLNAASIDFCTRLGFKAIHTFKDGAYPQGDLIYMTMSREDCRWIRRNRMH
jgi:hypothetical protein